MLDENGETFNAAPREYKRTVELVVEVVASADAALDDTLDTIARQVERLLLTDDTMGETCNDFVYNRTRQVIKEEGDTMFGGCRIIFDATYLDRHPDDLFNETLPDLNTLTTEYNLRNAQPQGDRARTDLDLNP